MVRTVTLFGHGYLGTAIAAELERQGIRIYHGRHGDPATAMFGDVVIDAAGYTGSPNVDACEDHRADCIEGNVAWPLRLHKLWGGPVIHIGSGCVYQGDGDYTEDDEPNFDGSTYSASKLAAQRALRPWLETDSYLLRVRMPFGVGGHPKDLLTKMSKYETLVSATNSVSYVGDVARAVVEVARQRPEPGIYNAVNPGPVDNREIAEIMGWRKKWQDVREFQRSVRTPRSFCTLSSRKMDRVYRFRPSTEALEMCRR